MSEEIEARQQIILWDLVARGGTAFRKEMRPQPQPAEREPLVKKRLVSVAKGPRNSMILKIEKGGWEYIASQRPRLLDGAKGSAYDRAILQFVLSQIRAYAADKSISLEDIFSQPTELEKPSLESQITSAFFAVAGRPAKNQVRLRALREKLPDVSRPVLDQALIAMREAKKARFSSLSNPPDIADQGDSGLVVRDQTFHTIWIDQ